MNKPEDGSYIYWRFLARVPCPYLFGYVTYMDNPDLIRLGNWVGDTSGGHVVAVAEIEWKPYK